MKNKNTLVTATYAPRKRPSLACLAVYIVLCCLSVNAAENVKPNFVFILMDDMGWSDLSCYGSTFHQSPHIDKLAGQGMKFTQAYAAQVVCSPTRASILTGKYPARLHLTDWLPGRPDRPDQKLSRPEINQHLSLEETTLAEALKPAGYVSGCFGKWHLGQKGFEPPQQGFDVNFPSDQKGGRPGSDENEKGEFGITEAALKFIEENKSQPFFVYLPYWSVHIPLHARSALVEKYKSRINPANHQTNAVYAAMIESVDEQIGRVLDKLDELKLAEHTVVIFTSDNGGLHVAEQMKAPATSNFPLREGKGYLHEGGIREPLIVRWPGKIKAGSICETPMVSVDYFPTILEIAGVKKATNQIVDGQSLMPLLTQAGALKPREIFWHYPHYANQGGAPGGAIRDGDFKLIQWFEDGDLELYNVRHDIGERENLAEKMKDKANEMLTKLDVWRRNVGAQMMTPNPNWDPNKPREVLH